ncbi:phenylalanine--tRNA ligase subunit beta [Flaviaesturariibacter flavus]|uniref:Phenylalanine--tRNA ligase beta subunit n=1 Tax=Flaviaesturariibacter flavus TaxID=2502780 RepID=A0A4R1BBI3_9BACT|nr:phenylalanine--tRNA ligase subunit beta [Flaviaesturariibacter flavus]TCJ14371.1 phenylalanine--tRNA ligase subunit beta [Flaviaesturariibacter flavus]
MTISYNWLSEYLPVKVEPERLSRILTAIGLEVESMERFEEVKGGLAGLVIGEVIETAQHPNADKLRLTRVTVGGPEPLKIVCGAPNVAPGQRVVVATVGTTIYPASGEPLTMKVAKIRGEESHGMICAEDEIGLGDSHAGIMVLPADAPIGSPAAEYFKPYTDIIYEIGLTPNRADAMSHWGVARDVCAYLSHHDKKDLKPVLPSANIKAENNSLPVTVTIENTAACPRYSGVSIAGISVKPSPKWMQDRLKAIGLRPINNIVDITNYIQHETGQPLHAFDYDAIKGRQVIIKNEPEGTLFKTLDEKERKLSAEDLMICNAEGGMCIAGVFGGIESGVTDGTKNVFLESAFFDPGTIRKTSFRHGLRTDAATRFEKGVDISNTVNVLKRAAALVQELAGGSIASDIIDVYPKPEPKKEVILKNQYLKKLSGKNYHPETVKGILESLGFRIIKDSMDALSVEVPYHKRDVSLPADVVEEILRIDGLDNIAIPTAITITPSVEENYRAESFKTKLADALVGAGFTEILTNSITNSAYFSEEQLATAVRLLNNLSSELDIMRPSMLPTALEVIAFNSNRKQSDLRFFEYGKTYSTSGPGQYAERNHLCLYVTGNLGPQSWKGKAVPADIYFLKGTVQALLRLAGVRAELSVDEAVAGMTDVITLRANKTVLGHIGRVTTADAKRFDLKAPVFVADLDWDAVLSVALPVKIQYREVPRFPVVERDLALVVPTATPFASIEQQVERLRLKGLRGMRLFDVFESEKLGAGKKSLAVNFTFLDEEKTLTDKEIDSWMQKIMGTLEKELGAEIRK